MGLSRSAIYDRMDKKSPRYAADFPTPFSLGGGAVGWFQEDIDAWLTKCAAEAKNGAPSKARNTFPRVRDKAPAVTPAPIRATRPQQRKQVLQRGSLADAIVRGGEINTRLIHFLKLQTWTPAMGAMLVAGIEPPDECNEIPSAGIGLDGQELQPSDQRFSEAIRIHDDFLYWAEDEPSQEFEPHVFLQWCVEERLNSEWLRLFLDLLGFVDGNTVDLSAARFALLTSR